MSQAQVVNIHILRGEFVRPEVVRLPAVPRVGDRIKTGNWAWGTVKVVSWIVGPMNTDAINALTVMVAVESDED